MALSESGLAAQGILPGPMVVQGSNGQRVTVKPKSGPAPSGKRNYYVKPKASRKGAGRK